MLSTVLVDRGLETAHFLNHLVNSKNKKDNFGKIIFDSHNCDSHNIIAGFREFGFYADWQYNDLINGKFVLEDRFDASKISIKIFDEDSSLYKELSFYSNEQDKGVSFVDVYGYANITERFLIGFHLKNIPSEKDQNHKTFYDL